VDGNDEIIDCEDDSAIRNGGTISFDDSTNVAELVIKLNPNYSDQLDAINNQYTLYVDENLESDSFIVSEGAYLYDSQVGTYGGYTVELTKK
jgi:hypothetical protein